LNLWYLDDATLADTPERVFSSLQIIINKGQDVGLQLNPAKCEIAVLGVNPATATHIIHQFNKLTPGIQIIDPINVTLLGSPLTDSSIDNVLSDKTKKLSALFSRLQHLFYTAPFTYYALQSQFLRLFIFFVVLHFGVGGKSLLNMTLRSIKYLKVL
jgi:hypothetical protein